jgi:hypothetical protein
MGGAGIASGELLKLQGRSQDLTATPSIAADEVLDSTRAKITINEGTESTTFTIRVTGINTSIAGKQFGAHLHVGPCVGASGSSAGPHYNHEVSAGGKAYPAFPGEEPDEDTAAVNTDTEVWFDLVPDAEGMAHDTTTVQFVPVDYHPDPKYIAGVMSIVMHQLETDENGGAGARQACFPVDVPQWIPKPSPSPSPTQ